MKALGVPSGIALVIGATVGAGVFVSTGLMAQTMSPGAILVEWAAGALLALAGARAYAAIAAAVPRSGGEYRYLSELMHPALGAAAGWASLLIGFSAPVAINALAAAGLSRRLWPALPLRPTALALIAIITLAHALRAGPSKWTQNVLAASQLALVVGFVVVGLAFGRHELPAAAAAHARPGYATSMFYVMFAYSGWNTAVYAAGEFAHPARDVPRAMMIGCILVGALYLAVAWLMLANPGTQVLSAFALLACVAAMSAMTFAGPRVYASMARDGVLPHGFAGRPGRPPTASVLLQGALACVIALTQTLREALVNVSAVLVLFSALTAACVFRLRPRPSLAARACAALYAAAAAWMLVVGLITFYRRGR